MASGPGGSHGSHMSVRARILLVNSASNLHNYAMRLAPRLDRVYNTRPYDLNNRVSEAG